MFANSEIDDVYYPKISHEVGDAQVFINYENSTHIV